MSAKLERLSQTLRDVFGDSLKSLLVDRAELTIEVAAGDYLRIARTLRDHPDLHFEQLIDISGVDYSTFGNGAWVGARFASVAHLTSIWRKRDDNAVLRNNLFIVLVTLVLIAAGVSVVAGGCATGASFVSRSLISFKSTPG